MVTYKKKTYQQMLVDEADDFYLCVKVMYSRGINGGN